MNRSRLRIPFFILTIVATLLVTGQVSPLSAREKRVRHSTRHTVLRQPHRRIRRHDRHYHPHYSYRRGRFFRVSALGSIAVNAPFGALVVRLPLGYRHITCGDVRYYFYDGIFYRKHTDGYIVVRAPRVRFIPYGARRVLVNDDIYFEHDGTWYRHRDGEYELCNSPVPVEPEAPEAASTTTILIENSNGSRTPVELEAMGANQWKGPRGEIYDGLPAEEQLREGYGF